MSRSRVEIAAACTIVAVGALALGRTTPVQAAHSADTPRTAQIKGVVRAWSVRLNANDNAGLARLFRPPVVIAQGGAIYQLANAKQIAAWYSGLPCAGKIVSIRVQGGRYAVATFRLANRGKTTCDAPGQLAAARFEVVKGKIVSWTQVPVPEEQDPGPVA